MDVAPELAEWFVAVSAIALFGITGSLHCSGMCGPLAAAACVSRQERTYYQNAGTYHFARVITYGLLGLTVGIISSFTLQQFTVIQSFHSQYLGALMGFSIFVYAFMDLLRACNVLTPGPIHKKNSLHSRVRIHLQRVLPLSSPAILGITTALLPCGFLFAALTQAALVANPWISGIAMMVFAIATGPALALGGALLTVIQKIIPRHSAILIPMIFILASSVMIWRSLAKPHVHDSHHNHHHDGMTD